MSDENETFHFGKKARELQLKLAEERKRKAQEAKQRKAAAERKKQENEVFAQEMAKEYEKRLNGNKAGSKSAAAAPNLNRGFGTYTTPGQGGAKQGAAPGFMPLKRGF